MSIKLKSPVGKIKVQTRKKPSDTDEVFKVKQVIRDLGLESDLVLNNVSDQLFINAIIRFQRLFMSNPDGVIEPRGETLKKLNRFSEAKVIVVDLDKQILAASQNAVRQYTFRCTSGKKSEGTPIGIYKITRKFEQYRSKKYDAQMDYAMFFYKGYAIHKSSFVGLTHLLKKFAFDSVGSHGCVRLNDADAKVLFNWAPADTAVVIL